MSDHLTLCSEKRLRELLEKEQLLDAVREQRNELVAQKVRLEEERDELKAQLAIWNSQDSDESNNYAGGALQQAREEGARSAFEFLKAASDSGAILTWDDGSIEAIVQRWRKREGEK